MSNADPNDRTEMETIALPAESASVATARAFVRRFAHDHLADPFPAELLTSELVANVVAHAPRGLKVSVEPGPPFRVQVHDGARATPEFRRLVTEPPLPAPVDSPGGRGLRLVHELSVRMGMHDDQPTGKVVWFEL
jgi:anti-sigma regulatory factor (Ser/Thr protein kinase)